MDRCDFVVEQVFSVVKLAPTPRQVDQVDGFGMVEVLCLDIPL